MDYEQFENLEQEVFLDSFYPYDAVRLILNPLEQEDYPVVRKLTKNGLKDGIEDFLKKEGSSYLYRSDLSRFCFDDSVAQRILERFRPLHFSFDDADIYANDVCRTYRIFIYNESRDRFLNHFNAE